MNEKEMILEAMRKAGEPLDKAFAAMKKEGSIVSPVRCKWEPAQKE